MIRDLSRIVKKGILKAIYGKNGMTVKLGGSYKIRMGADFLNYKDFGKGHNSGWQRCMEYCRHKNVFFDIGAHIGLYSLPACLVLANRGRVFAFEPGLKNFMALNHHIRINGFSNISPYNYLIGEAEGKFLFYEDTKNVNPMNSLILSEKIKSKPQVYKELYREQIRLDSFCFKKNVVPDLIKIDTEGTELLVLKGAEEVLRKHGPAIFLSLHPKRMALLGHTAEQLALFVRDLGYDIRNVDNSAAKGLAFGEYLLRHK